MPQFNNLSLRTKLIVISLIISIVPLAVIGYLAGVAIRVALVNAANESLAGAAVHTAARVDGFIQFNLDTVRTEAQLPQFGEYLDLLYEPSAAETELFSRTTRITTMLHALSRRDQVYILSYALLDEHGINVIDTDNDDTGHDQSGHDYFRKPLATGLPYASPVEFPETAGGPSIYFSAPVRDAQGKTVGVLRIRYNAAILQAIVTDANGLAGMESYAVLLDDNHLRLADGESPDSILKTVVPLDPAKAAELQAAARLPRRPADQLSTDLPAFEQGLTDIAAQPFFRAELEAEGHTLEAVAVAPMTTEPWLVAFAQEEAVFLAPVAMQTRNSFLAGAIMIAVVVLAVAVGSRLFTGPIVRLTAVAGKVGAGDLTAQARVEANDETGVLAATFNSMVVQLRQTLDGLAERSAELRRANDRLQAELAERQRAEVALRESEVKYRTLVDEVSDGFYVSDLTGTLTFANRALAHILGVERPEALMGRSFLEFVPPAKVGELAERYQAAMAVGKGSQVIDTEVVRQDGARAFIEIRPQVIIEAGRPVGNRGTLRDVTERKRAEADLAKLHRAVESSGEVIFLTDREGVITYVNPEFTKLYGYTAPEVIGQTTPRILKSGMLNPQDYKGLWETILSGQTVRGEWINRAKDGRLIEIDGSFSPIQDDDGSIIGFLAIQRDLTERKRVEAEIKRRLAELEAVNRLSTAMRAAHTLNEILPVVLDVTLQVMRATAGAIWLYDPVKNELRIAAVRGWDEGTDVSRIPPEKPGEGIAGHVFASRQPYAAREYRLDLRLPETVRQRIPPGIGGAAIPIRAGDAVIGTFDVNVALPRELTPDEVHLLTILGEIAGNAIQRTRLHEQTEQRLQRLDGLHQIDTVINASLDLHLTLGVFVDQVVAQLGVDAAAVILLNRQTQMLEYTAGRGFRSPAIAQTRQRLGEGNTGRAALERRVIHIPDLRQAGKMLRRTGLLSDEGFVAYYGVPLIAKGQVKGVLEVFHRAPIEPDEEWLDFLNTLAGQAAIAVDNAMLFNDLQRSNSDLTTAYDATIEGWSRALDLRDKETEGHTRRVTDVTLRLARNFGLGEAQLAQVRWGALLHDIGKMGVPDRILLKPGPLTDEEWAVMKQHPTLAYEMLSPIRYLRSALDIPYSHHEKWDGTGYPQGLKGEGIPLTARIFAVVDVWDALRSDRPYRPAWPEEKVIEHIRSLAGTHFDPQVVKVCLESGVLASGERQ